ncbi:MAG: hypothetical protein ACUVTA_05920 [Thermodesulfitimonas sp.]
MMLGRGTTVAAVKWFVAVLDGAVRRLRGRKAGGIKLLGAGGGGFKQRRG